MPLPTQLPLQLVVMKVTKFLNGVRYRRYVHEKGLTGPILLPHRKVESGVLLERHLYLKLT